MIFLTLDSIVRRYLLNRQLPIHFYIETLTHAATALHELNVRTLAMVNTVRLLVNSYGAIELPAGFVDEVGVYLPIGGYLRPVPQGTGLSPLRNRDENGAFVPYDGSEETFPAAFTSLNFSDLGEPTGGVYGAVGGSATTYQKFPERREIQINGPVTSSVVLKHISDGNRADNATEVDTRATRCIHSFVDWQMSPNAKFKDSAEARTYYNEERLLRAALNNISIQDIRDALHKSYTGTIKN